MSTETHYRVTSPDENFNFIDDALTLERTIKPCTNRKKLHFVKIIVTDNKTGKAQIWRELYSKHIPDEQIITGIYGPPVTITPLETPPAP